MRVWAANLSFPPPGPLRLRLRAQNLAALSPSRQRKEFPWKISEGWIHPAVQLLQIQSTKMIKDSYGAIEGGYVQYVNISKLQSNSKTITR